MVEASILLHRDDVRAIIEAQLFTVATAIGRHGHSDYTYGQLDVIEALSIALGVEVKTGAFTPPTIIEGKK